MRTDGKFIIIENLFKLAGGDSNRQKEVFNETIPVVSPCGAGVQIPHGLVHEIQVQNFDRKSRAVFTRFGAPIMRMAEDRDLGG
jgi:hypothetical protein